MSKMELVDAVVGRTESTRSYAGKAVDAVFDTIQEGLRKDGQFRVSGFGSFVVKDTAARRGRNPQTGEDISIPAGRRVSFKAGIDLKGTVTPKPKKGPAKKAK